MAQMVQRGAAGLSLPQQAEKPIKSFDTQHRDLIHDAQLDYFGKTLATASSDCLIKIFEVTENKQTHITDLHGHEGPVWRVSWAHPTFGQVLASCGYDRRVIVWRVNKNTKQFEKWFVDQDFGQSVNCIEFAPHELGLTLAAGCADGSISIYTFDKQSGGRWIRTGRIEAHNGGVNSLSWSQQVSTVSAVGSNRNNNNNNKKNVNNEKRMRFVSGGCDSVVKIWNFNYEKGAYECLDNLKGHSDWVRDVAWSPIPGSGSHGIVASCGEDKQVIIWKEKHSKWQPNSTLKFNHKIWSVSWSEMGNILGIAQSENTVQLFKEGLDGKWTDISKVQN